MKLAALDAMLWAATLLSAALIEPISRRLVNLPYVLWAASHNVLVVGLLLAVDALAPIPATSLTLKAVNRNQLAFFLMANLMTGAVNLHMRTLYAPSSTAFVILLGYMFSLCLVFALLDCVFNVSLKFW
jgi:glucosaminylphosphatidylinositol acyltransferase